MCKVARKRGAEDLSQSGSSATKNEEIPEPGQCYLVDKACDGKIDRLTATVIHVDYRSAPQNEGDSSPSAKKEKREGSEDKLLMFYVHYDKLDRRMDEWLTRDQLLEKTDPPAGSVIASEMSGGDASAARHRALTRSQRRIHEEFNHMKIDFNTMDAVTARLEREHQERTKVKNIPKITIGRNCMNSWYYSPFPPNCNEKEMYMCEYCLVYTTEKNKFRQHYLLCKQRQPPGNEIYRKDALSVYEVDGSLEKLYCQCLCLLSKLFMDHKTLYFDVDDFIFYVMCEVDKEGAHIVGYFSREVESANNLACIMVFPPFQKRGYGKLLIQLSYEISTREGYIGTPEKPLSDLGKVSYRSYWWWVLLSVLCVQPSSMMSSYEISEASGIARDDIFQTLQNSRMIRQYKDGDYMVRATRRVVEHCIDTGFSKKPSLLLDKTALRWRPQLRRDQAEELRTPTNQSRKMSFTQVLDSSRSTNREFMDEVDVANSLSFAAGDSANDGE